MAISRAQLVKELEPGLNALFGLEYKRYENQHAEIYTTESSDRAFEEEVMLSGFANADVKAEGQEYAYDDAQETYTARYTMETIALAFAITEEAIEDNLYDRLSSRYTKALARSMSNAKEVKGAAPLNNGLPAMQLELLFKQVMALTYFYSTPNYRGYCSKYFSNTSRLKRNFIRTSFD